MKINMIYCTRSSYGCETWSVTLKVEHGLTVFENRVLRIIFGPKRDKVRGEWRRLHNEEIYDLYSSSNIIQIKKRWTGLLARMGRQKKCIENLVGKTQGKNYLEKVGVDGGMILKWIFKKRIGRGMDWINLAQNRDR